MLRLMNHRRLAVGMTSQQARTRRPTKKLFCFDESQAIRRKFISVHVRQQQLLYERIMTIIDRAYEMGLVDKWKRDAEDWWQRHSANDVGTIAALNAVDDVATELVWNVRRIVGACVSVLVLVACTFWAIFASKMANKRLMARGTTMHVIMEKILSVDCLF